jgi:hypothetical protein
MPAFLLLAALALSATGRDEPAPVADAFQADPSWKPLGKDIWFDPGTKRVVLRARVALRDGALEHLLCRRNTKEHEAILATDAPPQLIHAGLLLTGATPGRPVQFRPDFQPPSGPPIRIELEWSEGGKTRRADARQWVKDLQGGRTLDKDWVFAGSELIKDPETKKTIYTADDGDLITVANFPSAILDLPFASSANDADRPFVANTDQIPASGTHVTMFLRPRPSSPVPPKSR